MGKRSREVRDADAPYRASYGRPGPAAARSSSPLLYLLCEGLRARFG